MGRLRKQILGRKNPREYLLPDTVITVGQAYAVVGQGESQLEFRAQQAGWRFLSVMQYWVLEQQTEVAFAPSSPPGGLDVLVYLCIDKKEYIGLEVSNLWPWWIMDGMVCAGKVSSSSFTSLCAIHSNTNPEKKYRLKEKQMNPYKDEN